MALLNIDDIQKIEEAVKASEMKTSGEIATAIIKESDSYAIYEMNFAIVVGFIYFFIMQLFTADVSLFLQSKVWEFNESTLVMFYGFSTFLVIFISYFLLNIPALDRLIIPKKIMSKKVSQRAIRHFIESGVINTKDRTGILIFISILERKVELIADEGISAKIPQEKWQEIVNNIVAGIKNRTISKNFVESITMCGDLLSEHFPIEKDDVNELSDAITILEE